MRPLEFGVSGFYPPFTGAARAAESEAMGYDVQYFPENHSRVTDAFGEMRDAVSATSRIKLAAGPVNFLTRHPGVVASAALPLQILSAGRVICAAASGDSAAAAAGRPPQRISELESDLRDLRTYLNGDPVEYGERSTRIEWVQGLEAEPPPIEMMCSGPRAIAAAARVADRIGLGIGANPERVKWALGIIDEALGAAGKDRNRVRIGMSVPIAIAGSRSDGRELIRTRVAPWAHMSSGRGIDLADQPEILRRVTTRMRDGYDYQYHHYAAPRENPNTDMCDADFGDWMGIGGPPAYVIDRLAELVDLGIDFFTISLQGSEKERFAGEVIPPLRAIRAE